MRYELFIGMRYLQARRREPDAEQAAD